MNTNINKIWRSDAIQCVPVVPALHLPGLADDVYQGLMAYPRSLPPKYFYDERGTELFNRICEMPEYYLTRTEDALLQKHGAYIIALTRPVHFIEFGAGNCQKAARLFDACERDGHTCTYLPFDICEAALAKTAGRMQAEYLWLDVRPLVGDYHAGLDHLPKLSGVKMYMFMGSSIGNFSPAEAKEFVRSIALCMEPGDFFLLGADRVKDPAVLNDAYNDAHGITAQFNLNILEVLNRELDADFRAEKFAHFAVYNNELNRIEMYLVSLLDQQVALRSLDAVFSLTAGEKILTELSYKYYFNDLETLLEESGLTVIRHFAPGNRYFSLVLAQRL